MITGLPPRVAVAGPLVEIGSVVARVCAIVGVAGDGLGKGAVEGDGDGEGETVGEGDGVGEGEGTGSTVIGAAGTAEAFCC